MTETPLRRRLGRLAAASGAATLALSGLTTASAAIATANPIIENTHFHGSYTHIEQEAHEGWCPEVPFTVEASGSITFGFQTRTRGLDGAWYYSGRWTLRDVYTNLENGKTLTLEVAFRFADGRIVDNGDGTITISGSDTVSSSMFAGSVLVGHDAGRVSYTALIDTHGTVDPEDDVLVSEEVGDPVGVYTLGERDHCADMLTYLS